MSKRLRQKPDVSEQAAPTKRRKLLLTKKAAEPVKPPRQMTIGAGSIVSVLILIILLGAWGAGMTLMLLFGDRMSQKLIVQNSEMQDAYEQRLQAFRAEIARLSLEMEQSKFDQNSVEGRVVELGRRQRQIESRLQALNRLTELVAPGFVGSAPSMTPAPGQRGGAPAQPPGRGPAPAGPPTLSNPPAGTNRGAYEFEPPPIQYAQLGALAQFAPPTVDQAPDAMQAEIDQFIERMDASLRRAEQSQTIVLNTMIRLSEARVERLRAALRDIGMSPDEALQIGKGRAEPAVPAIILAISEQNGPFAERIGQVRQNYGLMHRMRYLVESLPLLKPTPNDIRYSSGFGYRIHPIHKIQRLHAGIDMAAPIGTPIRASGSGVVISAGWGGGYGNLVQIDHGNGLISRYAHLSQIDVTTGQPVASGALIGRMGSTGASTGSHLHFETRIHGTPVNPACFMHAGDKIAGVQTVPLTCDKRPTWSKQVQEEEEDDDS